MKEIFLVPNWLWHIFIPLNEITVPCLQYRAYTLHLPTLCTLCAAHVWLCVTHQILSLRRKHFGSTMLYHDCTSAHRLSPVIVNKNQHAFFSVTPLHLSLSFSCNGVNISSTSRNSINTANHLLNSPDYFLGLQSVATAITLTALFRWHWINVNTNSIPLIVLNTCFV